jgi:hypothetical protein
MPDLPLSRRGFVGAAGIGFSLTSLAAPVTNAPAAMKPATLRQRLLECLGGPWPDPCPLDVHLRARRKADGFRIETLTYEVEPGDRVAGHLLIPDGVDAARPAPAIAVWHQRRPVTSHRRGVGAGRLRSILPRCPLLRGTAGSRRQTETG